MDPDQLDVAAELHDRLGDLDAQRDAVAVQLGTELLRLHESGWRWSDLAERLALSVDATKRRAARGSPPDGIGVTVAQAAELEGQSRQAIYDRIQRGEIEVTETNRGLAITDPAILAKRK